MATITGSVAGGAWNTGGAWVGGVQPGTGDDVLFTASTGNISIPTATTVVCRSLNCTGYTGTLTFASTSANLNIGDATAGLTSVALTFVAGMTLTLTGIGGITFVSTSATVQTITTGGKTMPTTSWNGAAGSWQLADNFTSSAQLILTQGTLDTNSKTINCTFMTATGTVTRTLTMGSSAINCSSTAVAWNARFSGLTVTSNTAVITCSGAAAQPNFTSTNGGNYNGTSFVFSGGGSYVVASAAAGTTTIANLTYTGLATKLESLLLAGNNLVVTGAFTVNSNSDVNSVGVASQTLGTPYQITAGSVVFTNRVDFQDITGAGAATWSVAGAGAGATVLGDALGNSGITFTTPVSQNIATSGAVTWSTITWPTRLPLPQDSVTFNGGAGAITMDMPRTCKDIDMTGSTRSWARASAGFTIKIYGSITITNSISTTNWNVQMLARSSVTLKTNGQTINPTFAIAGFGGTFTLQDNIVSSVTITIAANCAFIDNGKSITYSALFSTAGTITATGTYNMSSSTTTTAFTNAGTWNGGTETLNMDGSINHTFNGGGGTFGTLVYNNAVAALTITGSNTFKDIQGTNASSAWSILFTSATTQTFTAIHALASLVGASGFLGTVRAVTAASPTTFAFPNGYGGGSDWLSVKDITATTNTWYAGANSTNVSGNTNVTFSAPVTASNGNFLGYGFM